MVLSSCRNLSRISILSIENSRNCGGVIRGPLPPKNLSRLMSAHSIMWSDIMPSCSARKPAVCTSWRMPSVAVIQSIHVELPILVVGGSFSSTCSWISSSPLVSKNAFHFDPSLVLDSFTSAINITSHPSSRLSLRNLVRSGSIWLRGSGASFPSFIIDFTCCQCDVVLSVKDL